MFRTGKITACLLVVLALQNGAFATRHLQQSLSKLPDFSLTSALIPPVASPDADSASFLPPKAPAPRSRAPAPSPATAAARSCALGALVDAGSYKTLVELVEASSDADLLTQILESPDVDATLLAPTDAAIAATAKTLGVTLKQILADPLFISEVLTYHILPSNLKASDFKDGYSFNTELSSAGIAQSVAIKGSGMSATFVGGQSTGKISGKIFSACKFTVIPLDGLLVP